MKTIKNLTSLSKWTAVLALLIAPLATPVMAQATDTITITGTFTSDSGEHTWSGAMYGTTYWHHTLNGAFITEVSARSFGLRFFGPDADNLNRLASEQLAGGSASLELRNVYQGSNLSRMALSIVSPGGSASFWAGHEMVFTSGVFPFDVAGYPIVTLEPFSFWNEETYISWYGVFEGNPDGLPNAVISGSLGSEVRPPSPTVSIGDSSVAEGNRGSTQLQFTVSRSGSSEGTVSVDYRTVAGAALANSDYNAASGTLTFQPGETSRTISVLIQGDRKREANETFSVQLSNAVGATIDHGLATGTILNDD